MGLECSEEASCRPSVILRIKAYTDGTGWALVRGSMLGRESSGQPGEKAASTGTGSYPTSHQPHYIAPSAALGSIFTFTIIFSGEEA